MNTPTHFLMTAGLIKALPRLGIHRGAAVAGSVAPDVPLYAISLGAYVYFHHAEQWTRRSTFRHMFDTLYFKDPFWMAAHNILHSPVSLLAGIAVAWWLGRRFPRSTRWTMSFLLACLLHSLVDIVTHHDDGPLLWWPLNWEYRFASPISYWDHRHFGTEVARFELALDAVLMVYLCVPWLFRKLSPRDEAP